ncbi:MAG: Intervening sequence [Candidatus Roizmanbacteria bacterium GW2011_GWA2_35_19]|uniref:Intervening sequence n=2 Tax=Candidatus Roizmaniibacteriota TaxID=1752723 RepID=A0A0G0CAL5_9BACT|nr:MAG: Intervening sequence [Candidatus Roizmanbacteria bacterium GW2011_GWC2_35_12]KKP73146.1 MAG: Intervening sequence [Candidatus Roizmanbacteria bacterium GW2011_GWA2_35_19]
MIQSFKDLEIYTESYELAIIVNKEVNKFPFYENNDLGSQLRRCSKSIPANIAEGWAKRRFSKEFKHHLDIAVGSCNEMEVHISMAKDLDYWKKEFCESLLQRYIFLGGKIVKLRDNWKTF